MPTIDFDGQRIDCASGTPLRKALLSADLNPHNGNTRWFNCKGMGTCGTCAVQIDGPVSEPTIRERARLSFPPHEATSGLRLSCQTKVLGDVRVIKFPGFWGQHIGQKG